MQVYNATVLPVFLPYDKAPVPFGDPITDVSFTSASPAVITATGYNAPANNDAVQFSVTTAGNSLPPPLVQGTTYYVIGTSVSGNTFSISTAKNGTPVATTGGTGTGTATIHLVSNQVDGVTLPFKPGNSAVLMNLGANQASLYGASDVNSTLGYGNPGGPGTWNLIATAQGGTAQIINLGYDWIKVSASGTLVLLQN